MEWIEDPANPKNMRSWFDDEAHMAAEDRRIVMTQWMGTAVCAGHVAHKCGKRVGRLYFERAGPPPRDSP